MLKFKGLFFITKLFVFFCSGAMLTSRGYFRGIDCPDEKCMRPYCLFRHANAHQYKVPLGEINEVDQLEVINQEIDQLKNEIGETLSKGIDSENDFTPFGDWSAQRPSYSYSTVETEAEAYVPYKPHEKTTVKTHFSSVSDKLPQEKSFLHGAKGASLELRDVEKSVHGIKYSVSSTSKPVNDLEYDPMCNYNLKHLQGKTCQASSSERIDFNLANNDEADKLWHNFVIEDITDEIGNLLPENDGAQDFLIPSTGIKQFDSNKDSATVNIANTPSVGTDGTEMLENKIHSAYSSNGKAEKKHPSKVVPSSNKIIKKTEEKKKFPIVYLHRIDGDSAMVNQTNVKAFVKEISKSVKHKKSSRSDEDFDHLLKKKIVDVELNRNSTNCAEKLKNKVDDKGDNHSQAKKRHASEGVMLSNNEKFKKNLKKTKLNYTIPVIDLCSSSSDDDSKISNLANTKLRKECFSTSTEHKKSSAHSVLTSTPRKSKVRKDSASRKPSGSQRNIKDSTSSKPKIKQMESLKRASSLKSCDRKKKPKFQNAEANINKFIDKDEIAKLDKELNGIGVYEECFRIYQDFEERNQPSKVGNKSRNNKSVPEKKVCARLPLPNDVSATRTTVKESKCDPPQRCKRIAHSSASQSANSLKRIPKQVQRRLTPAQAMMQRVEIMKKEQESKILSAARQLPKDLAASLSGHSVLQSENPFKPKSSHLVPTRKTTGVTKRPFEDLRRSSNASVTTKATLSKGYSRAAHEPKVTSPDKNKLERPRILPNRYCKIPTNIRQRYLTIFIEECLRICENDRARAYQYATAEEMRCQNRSKSKAIYLNLAASAIKKLRNIGTKVKCELTNPSTSSTAAVVFKSNCKRVAHGTSEKITAELKQKQEKSASKTTTVLSKKPRICQGGYSFTKRERETTISGEELYERMCTYILSEEQLQQNGFPRPSDASGKCKFMVETPKLNKDPTKKICARCGKQFVIFKSGHFANTDDECIHHWGKPYSTKVGSHWEKRYSCCQVPIGTEGCSVAETHVHQDNKTSCSGYITTIQKSSDKAGPGIYALDCEMAYTVVGLELIRLSVVDFDCNLVYDTLVQPTGKILDYNTRWSGLTEEDLKDVTTTLRDVQAVCLNKFSADTILIGHSLESDLTTLRLIHSSVVDTSIIFPHRLGPPYKRALRNLMAEYLGIIIQNSVDEGHDSTEDASACVKLMDWKLKEDAKLLR